MMSYISSPQLEDGWLKDDAEPFDNLIGGTYYRHDENGDTLIYLDAAEEHANGMGTLHGGCLLTIADNCLFQVARRAAGHIYVVTLSLNSEFLSAGRADIPVIARGNVTRAGRSMIFARGEVMQEDKILLTFSGVCKVLENRTSQG